MRVGTVWLEQVFLGDEDDDARVDREDWLAGRDRQIVGRRNARDLAAVAAAGGEVG